MRVCYLLVLAVNLTSEKKRLSEYVVSIELSSASVKSMKSLQALDTGIHSSFLSDLAGIADLTG